MVKLEVIKELALQAGATVMERSGGTDYGTLDLDVEKFAELIVRECIEAHADYYGVDIVSGVLKQHFGVEE